MKCKTVLLWLWSILCVPCAYAFPNQAVGSSKPDDKSADGKVKNLKEVVVYSGKQRMLHILGYTREYSTLASYGDTVVMFREKMVDFMLPATKDTRAEGWKLPRVLKSRSYYKFLDAYGNDSVSDRCNHSFSWSDWMGIPPEADMTPKLFALTNGSDTINGKYSPAEIWTKDDDKITIDVNVLADTIGRRWVPNLSHYLRKDDIDFEDFRVCLKYDKVIDGHLAPIDLESISFNIQSQGRGDGVFLFNRPEQPFFVSTYGEMYIVDKEVLSPKEAKKWNKRDFYTDKVQLCRPNSAPQLQPQILALVDRVNAVDHVKTRMTIAPDMRLMSKPHKPQNFGQRLLQMFKNATGISSYRANKNNERQWDEFKQDQINRNK